jgi:hypothetical protein
MSAPEGITAGGLTFMIVAWTVITGLVSYCFWMILRTHNNNKDR